MACASRVEEPSFTHPNEGHDLLKRRLRLSKSNRLHPCERRRHCFKVTGITHWDDGSWKPGPAAGLNRPGHLAPGNSCICGAWEINTNTRVRDVEAEYVLITGRLDPNDPPEGIVRLNRRPYVEGG